MPKPICEFSGQFQVWAYTVSHSQLLLRSPKSSHRSSQIDVLFKNVASIKAPTRFDGLSLFESPYPSDPQGSELGSRNGTDLRIYMLHGTNYEGQVVAGTVVWNEGDYEYNEPSPLLEPRPV